MKKKPDMLWVLAFLFGLGVVTTGYAQGFLEARQAAPLQERSLPAGD